MVTDQISGPNKLSIKSSGLSKFGGITHIREKGNFSTNPFVSLKNVFHDILSVLKV